jgi:hypothetical protein
LSFCPAFGCSGLWSTPSALDAKHVPSILIRGVLHCAISCHCNGNLLCVTVTIIIKLPTPSFFASLVISQRTRITFRPLRGL